MIRPHSVLACLATTLMVGFTTSALAAAGPKIAPKNDPLAHELAKELKPLGMTAKADLTGLTRLKVQVEKVLSVLEDSSAHGGPTPESLLQRAYAFVPEVGPEQATAAIATISAAWHDAHALGLYLGQKYTGKISNGDDAGHDVVVEYILPPTQDGAEAFSQDLTNFRLVRPTMARNTPSSVSSRDRAYLPTLKAIAREIAGRKKLEAINHPPPMNAVGQTKEQAEKSWLAEMKAGGDASQELPQIVIQAEVVSTPDKANGETWHVQATVSNLSPHATEIDVECFLIGHRLRDKDDFIMVQKTTKLHLRRSQVERTEFATGPRSSYDSKTPPPKTAKGAKPSKIPDVNYLGAYFRVNHAKGLVTTFQTIDNMNTLMEKLHPTSGAPPTPPPAK